MIEFFSENLSTILITLVVILLMGLAIYSMVRNKKKGGSCSGCSGCSHSSGAKHKHADNDKSCGGGHSKTQ